MCGSRAHMSTASVSDRLRRGARLPSRRPSRPDARAAGSRGRRCDRPSPAGSRGAQPERGRRAARPAVELVELEAERAERLEHGREHRRRARQRDRSAPPHPRRAVARSDAATPPRAPDRAAHPRRWRAAGRSASRIAAPSTASVYDRPLPFRAGRSPDYAGCMTTTPRPRPPADPRPHRRRDPRGDRGPDRVHHARLHAAARAAQRRVRRRRGRRHALQPRVPQHDDDRRHRHRDLRLVPEPGFLRRPGAPAPGSRSGSRSSGSSR